ncbi:MAG TPA: bifunctional [glutamate--ammonia ligase]-adenylyl-L-tyrosine phosphorylase/[glutamate--ammonia-ligase] adenylyltransferase [Sutterella sp.]|nr:bifunctional [glutamate--ammonia ligase]-adenylyl-L-tyrosine phosphorylase/[glutamate--ammonia-ligase] adenylyltransferase [Sutterella sp.]
MPRLQLSEVPEYSFYVKRSLEAMRFGASAEEQMADLARLAAGPVTREQMAERLGAINEPEEMNLAMRRLRRDVMVSLIARDLTGEAGYQEVVETMTALAEETVSHCVRVESRALARRFGVPMSEQGVPQDLIVVGMGKLGGAELNVSSDIDLVFVYDEAGETQAVGEFANARRTLTNHEFFEKLSKRVIPALNDLDGIGFVFRVDMRLRPFGDAGPIAVSMSMLEEYLYTEGRDWERFAWLKGRVISRPVFMGNEAFESAVNGLNSLVRPFVFRKYVDFSAISALSRLHELIRAQTIRREAGRNLGINVKLGKGGIREIEFITQTFQIIRGGRERELRGKSTLPMLQALAEHGAISRQTAERLAVEYVFLRNLEHALQYVDDKQTQVLGNDGQAQARIAAMLGMQPGQMLERLESCREFVSGTFDEIFHIDSSINSIPGWPVGWHTGDEEGVSALEGKLRELGYADPRALAERVSKLLNTRLKSSRSADAKTQFTRFVVHLADHANEWAREAVGGVSGDEVFHRYLELLEVVVGRTTYVALLNQYPSAAARVGKILAVSRWAAQYITAHPLLLDELVDGRGRQVDDYTPVDWSGWLDDLRREMIASEGDQERQMNLLRDAHHAAVFRLLLADLDGRLTVERLADQLSALADAVLSLVLDLAWHSIPTRHIDQPRFAVIGYGKLGGKELGYASDLDIIFLYDDPSEEALTNYPKLVRRMMSWLTVQTSSGILFDIDMRLRPNGQNGLIASSMEMFRRYQRNEDGNGAWLWEHQALTRARFCAGDPEVGAAFEKERSFILTQPRNRDEVVRAVIEMRSKMLDGHPNATELFDVKHDRGGMVDIEFIVQALVLAHAHDHPELVNNFGNTLLLEMAGRLGLIPEQYAAKAPLAYRKYRNIQRRHRLLNEAEGRAVRVPLDEVREERDLVLRLWELVMGSAEPVRNRVQ